MQCERRVLRLLQARCTFKAPRVLREGAAGAMDVRSMVGIDCDTAAIEAAARGDADTASAIGAAIGKILAEQHTRIALADVEGWLRRAPSWPESRAWIVERIRAIVDDRSLLRGANAVMSAYEELRVRQADCALVHTDVALHNVAFDAEHRVCGVYDYEEAAWADRHHDFRYLALDDHDELSKAAMSAYRDITGYAIRADRIALYHAACALTYLAHRAGTAPDERSCGRTLAEDLRWSRAAIARVLPASGDGSLDPPK
jgi:aminoglycoside phosphotransferase (APT) family kinase protein